MLLGDHFKKIRKKYHNVFFSGITFDHRKIKKNYIFFAVKGNNLDGNNFIPLAIKKGCKIIVSEKKFDEYKNKVLFIHTKNIRKLLAQISFSIFKKKPNNLIAVTGTNGKSSVSDFYYQILSLNNKKVASIGTLGVRSNNLKLNLSNTTIDPINLSKILNKLKKKKLTM
jgi:murE/murF fusion protein